MGKDRLILYMAKYLREKMIIYGKTFMVVACFNNERLWLVNFRSITFTVE